MNTDETQMRKMISVSAFNPCFIRVSSVATRCAFVLPPRLRGEFCPAIQLYAPGVGSLQGVAPLADDGRVGAVAFVARQVAMIDGYHAYVTPTRPPTLP